MPRKIVTLEDNEDRKAAMRRCLANRFPEYESYFFDESASMIAFLKDHLGDTIVLSLDHDLELKPDGRGRWLDPGTGREIADYLAQQPPTCPVILHTSNTVAAEGMKLVLRDAGWRTRRVIPLEDTAWIPTAWFRSLRKVIDGSTSPRPSETGG